MMIVILKEWLSEYLSAQQSEIETYFQNNNVTGFLIIWTIFEKDLFNGFAKKGNLLKYATMFSLAYNERLDGIFEYFYNRYQDKKNYKRLVQKDTTNDIVQILRRPIIELSKTEKLLFLFYVVYRYRNNIFHGTKGVSSWIKFKIEIEKCIVVMIELIDFHKSKR